MNDLVNELIKVNQEQTRWLRFLAWEDLKRSMEVTLSEDWEFHLYDSLDGETSVADLAEGLPKSPSTVGLRLKNWRTKGLVNMDTGQYNKLVSLDVMNIDKPELDTDDEK